MAAQHNFIYALFALLFVFYIQAELDVDWTVYEAKDFDKNELCGVLACDRGDLCLVGSDNAICGREGQLDAINGRKRFFTSMTQNEAAKTDEQLTNDEWDQEKLRQKLLKHQKKLETKKQQKNERNLPNEVHYEPDLNDMKNKVGQERHGPVSENQKNCTDLELKSVRGRLFKWFSDIHALEKNEPFYELPQHEITCNENVGFMFATLDGDKNNKLTVDELYSLDYDPHEKCVKPLLDRCDLDNDDDLSLDEWCNCFQWSDDVYHEPACHVALRKHDPHDPDSFLANCDLEGFYKLDQCQKGVCWCVDKWGREYDRSRTKGKANCHKYVL